MAGSRKRGGNKAKVKNFSLGDLVLAKVKGFPAWPAKISRPEDWEREPDPKKYFVQFFGTEEMCSLCWNSIVRDEASWEGLSLRSASTLLQFFSTCFTCRREFSLRLLGYIN